MCGRPAKLVSIFQPRRFAEVGTTARCRCLLFSSPNSPAADMSFRPFGLLRTHGGWAFDTRCRSCVTTSRRAAGGRNEKYICVCVFMSAENFKSRPAALLGVWGAIRLSCLRVLRRTVPARPSLVARLGAGGERRGVSVRHTSREA